MANDFYDQDSLVYTDVRIKATGNIIEYTTFARSFAVGARPPRVKKPMSDSAEKEKPTKEEIRRKSLLRASKRITDLINTNVFAYTSDTGVIFKPVFLTLTYKENVTDLTFSNKLFQKFMTDLSTLVYNSRYMLRFCAVIEFQKRGAVHYHICLFNLPFVPFQKINKLWVYGSTNIHIMRDIKNIGSYITKYMTKDISDPRLDGHHSYLISKKLKKPVLVYYKELTNLMLQDLPTECIVKEEKNIPIKYLRSMDKVYYNLSAYPESARKLRQNYTSHFYDATPKIKKLDQKPVDKILDKWVNMDEIRALQIVPKQLELPYKQSNGETNNKI